MARARRWILRVLVGLIGLAIIAVVGVLILLANLEWGPVKRFAQGQARAQGLEIDYAEGSVTLGAVHLRDIRLRSPAADVGLAPDLVRVGAIDGSLSPFSKRIDDLVIKDVALTIVVDPDGKTSLDRLLAGMPPPEEKPPVPLSQLLATMLPDGITAKARIEGVTVTLIPRGGGDVTKLEGVTASARLAGGALEASVGPSELRLAMGKREAVARLAIKAAIEKGGKTDLEVDAELVRQDLSPQLPPVKKVLALKLSAEPRPDDKKTMVKLGTLSLLDGAATFQAAAELRDGPGGATVPFVESLSCRVDLVALSKAVPPEYGPLTVEGEPLSCAVRAVELGPPLKADISLTGKIARLVLRDLEVRGATLDVQARPDGDALSAAIKLGVESVGMPGLEARQIAADLQAHRAAGAKDGWPMTVKGTVAVASVKQPGTTLDGVRVALDGTARSPTQLDLQAGIDVASVAAAAQVGKTHLDVGIKDLVLADNPLGSTGTVSVRGKVAHVVQPKGPRVDDVTLAADLRLGKTAKADVTVDAGRLAVSGMPAGPLHLELHAPRLELDEVAPAKSRGQARVAATYGASAVDVTVDGSAEAFSWDLSGRTDRAGPARAITVASKGKYGARIEQDTTIDVGKVLAGEASLRSAKIHLVSAGTLRRQEATITAALEGVALRKDTLGSPRVELVAVADLDGPRVDARIKGTVPEADLHLVGEIDKQRTIHWELDGRVAKLGTVASVLPAGPRWNRLEVRVRGKGVASGVVRSVKDGVPVLVADPARTARGKQSLELDVRDLHYRGAAEISADVSALTVRADASLGDPHQAHVVVEIPELGGTASGVNLAVKGLTAELDAALSRRGAGKVELSVRAASIGQSAFAAYPVRDLDFHVTVTGDPQSAVKIDAALANPGAGTKLDLTGVLDERAMPAADAVPGRHSITVEGKLDQALDKLDGAPDKLRASGHVTIPFRVESGDLALFLARAQVKLQGVSVELPEQEITISGVDGELPVVQEIVMTEAGAEPVGSGARGLYPQLRFGDQQPFLGEVNYLSIGRVQVGKRALGPLAGNMRVDHDVAAIDQLEVSALDGKITGQTLIELRGKDTRLSFRGKVTGIRPSSGDDRLDAHAALTMSPYRLKLDGRIEIVRIGKKHLYDLLDILDPYHADVSMNMVRKAMIAGYPEQVRLGFEHGFAKMSIKLGGVASLVRISEMTPVAIGPALARYLAPILETP